MKKILSLVLAIVMVVSMALSFSSCKKDESSDWETVQEKGYFVCGITVYKPMNYFDENDSLVGFDTDFAQAVAKELGVEVKFQIINWGSKYLELESGSIDAIWNGFTYGNESDGTSRTEYVDFSYAYLNNSQCIVTAKNSGIATKADFAGKKGVAEGGSAGEAVAKELSTQYTAVAAQTNALMEVLSGTADFAVIDVLMANAYVGKGDYANLEINTAYEPEGEVYAIGFRKGSDLTAKVNEAIKKLSADGTLTAIAQKYTADGLSADAVIPNIGQ